MRSFIVKAALAAFMISTSLAGANAASSPGGHQSHGHSFNHNRADLPDTIAPATQATDVMPAYHMRQHVAPHQRLARIENELGAADHRITIDHRHGYLNAAETRQLRHEDRAIGNAAYHVAKQHHGSIPGKSYDRLQGEVHHLNRDIHRDATNA